MKRGQLVIMPSGRRARFIAELDYGEGKWIECQYVDGGPRTQARVNALAEIVRPIEPGKPEPEPFRYPARLCYKALDKG